ncbi:hypothetical protein I0C86_27710 [Plantactinospora sp. S1510]|uniref:Uncharacterized protein n=1 Tax=Plantactinospora alkalitolerans TaxID=2789879 RepID=A0ABS0H3C6_9ACTN|nr:hypothetical protein [Plantactinospora alkalitolerans]
MPGGRVRVGIGPPVRPARAGPVVVGIAAPFVPRSGLGLVVAASAVVGSPVRPRAGSPPWPVAPWSLTPGPLTPWPLAPRSVAPRSVVA